MGYVHIYCGDGKGKTSAALGLAVRAAGRRRKILLVRFLKTDDSGEVAALRYIPGIEVMPCDKVFGFVSRMDERQKAQAAAWNQERFEKGCRKAGEGKYDVLILDEIVAACNYGMVREEDVIRFIKERPEKLEVVLTGRDPSGALLALADYVSDIRMERHPFTKGIAAREGIEW